MFTKEELQALLQIINNTTFNGASAEVVVHLKQRVAEQLNKSEKGSSKNKDVV